LVGSSQLPMALVSWPSLGRKPEIAGMFVMAALLPCPGEGARAIRRAATACQAYERQGVLARCRGAMAPHPPLRGLIAV
jgi:hypothetical protein